MDGTGTEQGELSDAQLADVTGGADVKAASEAASVTADRVDHIQTLLAAFSGSPVNAKSGQGASPAEQDLVKGLAKLIGSFEQSHDLEDKNAPATKAGLVKSAAVSPSPDYEDRTPQRAEAGVKSSPAKSGNVVSEAEVQVLARIETVLKKLVPSSTETDDKAKTKAGIKDRADALDDLTLTKKSAAEQLKADFEAAQKKAKSPSATSPADAKAEFVAEQKERAAAFKELADLAQKFQTIQKAEGTASTLSSLINKGR